MSKVVFIDRDDTINHDVPYCSKPEDFVIIKGVCESVKRLNDKGFLIIVVTNQSGISRDYFTHEDLSRIHHKMKEEFLSFGAKIDDIFYCPCHPNNGCDCRKPNIGLFKSAEERYDIDKSRSYMIGDSLIDIEAGRKYGVKSILISKSKFSHSADYITDCIESAVDWIVKND